jgi:hypothetical protein
MEAPISHREKKLPKIGELFCVDSPPWEMCMYACGFSHLIPYSQGL